MVIQLLIVWLVIGGVIDCSGQEEDANLLLRVARDHRYGTSKTQVNFDKSIVYYLDAIERFGITNKSSAIVEFADMLFNSQLTINLEHREFSSFDLVTAAAQLGNPEAQHILAGALGTGIYEGLIPMDATRSVGLQYFASVSGHPEASMAMGYRYLNGIEIVNSCELARQSYEYAANLAAEQFNNRGYYHNIDNSLVTEIDKAAASGSNEVDDEVVTYYTSLADSGDMNAAIHLGNIYLHGTRMISLDLHKAVRYYAVAAKGNSSQATGALGYLLVRGQAPYAATLGTGFEINSDEELFKVLSMSAHRRDLNGFVGLGYAYYKGKGTQVNMTAALTLFTANAAIHPDAGFYMGEIMMKQYQAVVDLPPAKAAKEMHLADSSISTAYQFYSMSAQMGHVLAMHRLGHLMTQKLGPRQSCESAVNAFRSVAEKGDWMLGLNKAHKKYAEGNINGAIALFSKFAAIGIESAQFNAAVLLSRRPTMTWQLKPTLYANKDNDLTGDQHDNNNSLYAILSRVNPRSQSQSPSSLSSGVLVSEDQWSSSCSKAHGCYADCEERALALFSLSAAQANTQAALMMGDFFYYGKASLPVDKKAAVVYYQAAANLKNTHALFNLAVMHEAGDGVEQDFHLAKRFFDEAAAFDKSAGAPASFALKMLEKHQHLLDKFGPALTKKAWNDMNNIISDLKSSIRDNLFSHPTILSFVNFKMNYSSRQMQNIHWLEQLDQIANNIHAILCKHLAVVVPSLKLPSSSSLTADMETIWLVFLAALFVYIHGYRRARLRR